MSPRLSAVSRLEIGLQVIGLAADRDGITVPEAATAIGVSEKSVVDAVQPFTDLEYVHTSGHLLDDIGHAVTLDDGLISVQQHWIQDLTTITPGDAALLLAMIETAGNIESLDSAALRSLRRRLDAIAHVSMGEAVPDNVAELLTAKHAGVVVSARHEGGDMRVRAHAVLYEIHEVRWTPSGWRVLVSEYGDPEPEPRDLPAERLHDIEPTDHRFERRSLVAPEPYISGLPEVITLRYPESDAWLVAYFNPEVLAEGDGIVTARFRIDTGNPLRRLLLRLGADAKVLDPPRLANVASFAASRILELYE